MKKIFTCLGLLIALQGMPQICNTLDSKFGVNGLATNYKPDLNQYFQNIGMTVQPDGKIIGAANIGSARNYVIVQRFMSNGAADQGFAAKGIAYISAPQNQSTFGNDIVSQPDGRIIVVGSVQEQGVAIGFMTRLDNTGKPDSSFGNNSTVLTGSGSRSEYLRTVRIQSNGKILVAGIRYNDTTLCDLTTYAYPVVFVRRFNSDGSPDFGFGQGGNVNIRTGQYSDEFIGMALQSDGKFLVGVSVGYDCRCQLDDYYGYRFWSCNKRYTLIQRFSPDGVLDNGFGTSAKIADSTWNTPPSDMILQPDGKLLVSGVMDNTNLSMKRFQADGSVDPGFGSSGVAVLDVSNWEDLAMVSEIKSVVAADGKIWQIGNFLKTPNRWASFAARFLTNGQADTTFYGAGRTALSLGSNNQGVFLRSVALQGNEILVDGVFTNINSNYPIDLFIAKIPANPEFIPVDIKPEGPLSFCLADSVKLMTQTAGTYQWYLSGNAIGGQSQAACVPLANGNYQVRVINKDGCGVSKPVSVRILPEPGAPFISWNGTQLTGSQGYARYQWYLDNVQIAGATGSQHTPGSALGAFQLKVWNNEGCSILSAPFNLVITGIADIVIGDARMRLFPNPASAAMFIDLNQQTFRKVTVELYDLSGRMMERRNLQSGRNQIPLSTYRAGMYVMMIRIGNDREIRRIIVTH